MQKNVESTGCNLLHSQTFIAMSSEPGEQ